MGAPHCPRLDDKWCQNVTFPLVLRQKLWGGCQGHLSPVAGKNQPGGVANEGVELGGTQPRCHDDQEQGFLEENERIRRVDKVWALKKGQNFIQGPEDARVSGGRTL